MLVATWASARPPPPLSPRLPLPLLLLVLTHLLPPGSALDPTQEPCQGLEVSSSQSRQESRRTHGNLTTIPAPAPGGPPVVRLVLRGNDIRAVRVGDLTPYPCLQYLDLSVNNISSIQERTFDNSSRLQTLVLRRNHLRHLGALSLSGLTSLRKLDLSYNLLQSLLSRRFASLSSVSVLDLARNNISDVADDAFDGLTSLHVLNLTRNRLQAFPLKALSRLTSLETLVLDENQLASLPARAFSTLPHLTFLSLNGNRLTSIAPSAFSRPQPGLPSPVRRLLLKGTDLADVPGTAFQHLQELRILDLSQNDFPVLHAGCFQALGKLDTLVLTDMEHLRSVEYGAFRGLGNLEKLVLSHNDLLCSIGDGAFRDLTRLKALDLSHNALETFPASMANWDRMELVDLRGNSLHCDCRAAWMQGGLGENATSNQTRLLARELRCSSPHSLAGKLLMAVQGDAFRCPAPDVVSGKTDRQRVVTAAIVAAVTCVALMGLLLLFKFRRRVCSYVRRQYRYSAYKENGTARGTMVPVDTVGEEEKAPMEVIDLNSDENVTVESNGTAHFNGHAMVSHKV